MAKLANHLKSFVGTETATLLALEFLFSPRSISSYIGQQNVGGPGESSSLDMKWGKPNFSIKSAADSSAQNGTLGFASSLLDKYLPSSTHQQPAVSIFPLNSPPFSASKTALGSPVEVKDHVKI